MDAMRHSLDYVKEPLERIYHISEAEAERYFRDLWIVVYGIAALIVTGDCPYPTRRSGYSDRLQPQYLQGDKGNSRLCLRRF